MNKKILITGCPRGATKFIYTLLRIIGQNVTFEKKNSNGFTVSWKHILTGTFEHPCAETEIICDFNKIIHQTRHPLKTIASMTTLWVQSMNYLGKIFPLPDPIKKSNNTIKNCMIAYYHWNKLIESKAHWRYRIENLYNIQEEWCKQLEIPYKELPRLKSVNYRNHKQLNWQDLRLIDKELTEKIQEMAKRYGYSV